MKKIDNIVIIGGGTSAWLAAAYLSHNFKDKLKITVIDKEIGQPVGVGEGTILNFAPFLKYCGFETKDWFNQINATYKSGILFKNWQKEGEDVWHGFFNNPMLYKDISLYDAYTHNIKYNFKEISPLYDISKHNKIDKSLLDVYAYHVDAGVLTKFLQDKLNNKVTFIKSEVIKVNRNNEIVESLILNNGEIVKSDLFVDCTGWKNLLQYKPEKNMLYDRLFCDTAIASRIEYKNIEEEQKPYVISQAVEHGWIWIIPTQKRIGSGLVFNRNVTDIEEAKNYFSNFWNNRIKKETWKENLKVLDWTPYYKKNVWEGNTVSIGLSAGFIEPLESTGIALIMEGICQFYGQIKDNSYNDKNVNDYNLIMSGFFENSIDFINMHYTKNERKSKFWDYVRKNNTGENKLMKYMQKILLNEKEKLHSFNIPNDFFTSVSWYAWMIQLSYPYVKRKLDINEQEVLHLLDRYYTEIEITRKNNNNSILHHTHIIDKL